MNYVTDMTCASPDQIHAESGLCFGVETADYTREWTKAKDSCKKDHSAGLVAPNTQSKWDFLSSSTLFDGAP